MESLSYLEALKHIHGSDDLEGVLWSMTQGGKIPVEQILHEIDKHSGRLVEEEIIGNDVCLEDINIKSTEIVEYEDIAVNIG